jgi:hypothetical protein
LLLAIALVAGLAYATTGRSERLPSIWMYSRIFQSPVPGGAQAGPAGAQPGRSRAFTPAEVAALGGDVLAYGVRSGAPVEAAWNRQNRDKILAAKRIAAEQGVPIRFYVSARPDTYMEHGQWGVAPGFKDEWIMRTTRSQYERDVARFSSEGWRVEFASWVDRGFRSRILADPETAPCFYGFRRPLDKRLDVTELLADVRNPEYRAWHVAWVRELLAYTGAEGVVVAVKTGWHAKPMFVARVGPDTRWDGPLSPTPYGAGEFEAAMGAYLVELAAFGIPIVSEERPPGSGGFGAWYGPDVRAALLGEAQWLKLPRAEELDGPASPPRIPVAFMLPAPSSPDPVRVH